MPFPGRSIERVLRDLATPSNNARRFTVAPVEKVAKDEVVNVNIGDESEVLTANESLGKLIFDTDENGKIDRKCKLCQTGELSLKNSFRGGAFIGCSGYPEWGGGLRTPLQRLPKNILRGLLEGWLAQVPRRPRYRRRP